MQIDTWNVGGTSLSQHEEPIIRDIVDDISEDGENYNFDLDDEDQLNRSSSQYIPSAVNPNITLIATSMNTCLSCQRRRH